VVVAGGREPPARRGQQRGSTATSLVPLKRGKERELEGVEPLSPSAKPDERAAELAESYIGVTPTGIHLEFEARYYREAVSLRVWDHGTLVKRT
jgi:hypothetical protein